MKLLLTSGGIRNRSIAQALTDLVGKSPNEAKVAYIPTAANAQEGNKDWFINQFLCLWRYGYNWIDVVDPSAAGVEWRTRLEETDIIFVSGGNTFHLLDQYRQTGFGDWLTDNLESKVYVGVSAGTIIATPTIEIAGLEPRDPNVSNISDLAGLGWVEFEVEPHCDEARFEVVQRYAEKSPNPVYAIDDSSAVQVDGNSVTVISEGVWRKYD